MDIKAEELFTAGDYEGMLKLADMPGQTEYSAEVVEDLYVRIVHRPFRLDPSRMIYIVNLDQREGNLYNDDLYWRAEPVKFCHEVPDYDTVLAAVRRLLISDLTEPRTKAPC